MRLALMCFLALLASSPASTSPPPLPSFDSCEQLAAREPESEATAFCFDQTGAALKQTDKARTKLQELLRDHPGSPWPTFFLLYRDPKALAELPRWIARLHGGLSLLSPAAERKRVIALLGTWYAVALVTEGCRIEALPGWPVRCRAGEAEVDPFQSVTELADEKLSAAEFRERYQAVRGALAATS